MRIRSPGAKAAFTPPAALVTTRARDPRTPRTRAGKATVAASCPSYPWMRPCMARTGTPESCPYTRRPRWPGTVGAGKPGSASKEIEDGEESRSAKAPRPDPRTTATGETSDGRRRATRAARAQARARSVQAGTPALIAQAYGGGPASVLCNPHELRRVQGAPAA